MAITKDQTENKVLLTLFNSDLTRAGESAQANTDGTNVTFGEIQAIPGVETSENDTDFKTNTKLDITIPVDGTNTKYTYKYRRLKLSGLAKVKNINTEDASSNVVLKHNTEGDYFISDETYKSKVREYIKNTLDISSDTVIAFTEEESSDRTKSTLTINPSSSKLFNDGLTMTIKTRDDNFGIFVSSGTSKYFQKDLDFKSQRDSISEVFIPKALTEIPNDYFGTGAPALTANVYLHAGVTKIGNNAFTTGVTSMSNIHNGEEWGSFPKALTSIGDNAFYKLSGGITLPDSITSIGENAFGDVNSIFTSKIATFAACINKRASKSIYSVTYGPTSGMGESDPDHNTYSEITFTPNYIINTKFNFTASEFASNSDVFTKEDFNNKIKTLALSKDITEIKENVFSHITLTDKLDLTNITTIGANAFTGATIERIDFDNSLTTVGTDAFKDSVVAHVYVDTDAQITTLKALLPHLASSDWHSKAGGKEIESGGLKYSE